MNILCQFKFQSRNQGGTDSEHQIENDSEEVKGNEDINDDLGNNDF